MPGVTLSISREPNSQHISMRQVANIVLHLLIFSCVKMITSRPRVFILEDLDFQDSLHGKLPFWQNVILRSPLPHLEGKCDTSGF